MHDITAHHTEIGLFAHDDDGVGGQKRLGCVSMTFLQKVANAYLWQCTCMAGQLQALVDTHDSHVYSDQQDC